MITIDWLDGDDLPPLLVTGKRAIGKSHLIEGILLRNPKLTYIDLYGININNYANFLKNYIYESETIPDHFNGMVLKLDLFGKGVDAEDNYYDEIHLFEEMERKMKSAEMKRAWMKKKGFEEGDEEEQGFEEGEEEEQLG